MMYARSRTTRRSALLLEVLLSLAIMVSALGVLGAQLAGGLRMTADMDRLTRAAELTDRILALIELDPAMQEAIQMEQEIDGEFGDQFPGWFWQMTLEPTEVDGLGLVHVEILHQDDIARQDSVDGAKLVRSVSLLRASPGRIDLVADFGMDEDQVAELATLLPIPDFDPNNVDPQALMAFATENPETLLELLPALMPLLQQFAGTGVAPGGGGSGLEGLTGSGSEFGQAELEELLRLGGDTGAQPAAPGVAGGGAPPARGGRSTTTPRAGGGRQGGGASDTSSGGQPRYSIEDLMRMRDEMQQGGG